ncbi:MAG: type II toxin-antitoxin system PemK/MazF family toxin [Candidatus Gracilibacteria bacterium]|nr:type II toxin-antitoxin system PemK/MazF family toxin [Candidatus Gracilibacteria bacterium]
MDLERINLDISITRKKDFINLFYKSYLENIHKDFIENKEEKKHNINSHSNWFNRKIKLNHQKENIQIINKWKLCMVDYGMNIGTEINGVRPSIIFKSNSYLQGEDVFVIPITSFKDGEIKSIDEFDIELIPDNKNNLKNKSLLKLRQLRCISKKRIRPKKGSDKLNIFGEIVDLELRELIKSNIKRIFGT